MNQSKETAQDETTCSVCGSSASYHFYGAISCDSCRTFFRRYAHKPNFFVCINVTGECKINETSRKECSSCRLKKCFKVGMKPQLVRVAPKSPATSLRSTSTAQKSLQNNSTLFKIPFKPQVTPFTATLAGGTSTALSSIGPSLRLSTSTVIPHLSTSSNGSRQLVTTRRIPRPHIAALDIHIHDLTISEKTKLYEMLSVINCSLIRPEDCNHLIGDLQTDLNTLTCVFISRSIRALNMLQARDCIGTRDQGILLKNSVAKVLFLQSVPTYDVLNRTWYVYSNPVTRQGLKTPFPICMYDQLSPELAAAFIKLVTDMDSDARHDFIFMTILAAICFYDSSCRGLNNTNIVKQEQKTFYRILQKLIRSKMNRSDDISNLSEQLEERVLSRLRSIQMMFEDSILHIDPGEQIRLISRELKSSPSETLYEVPASSTTSAVIPFTSNVTDSPPLPNHSSLSPSPNISSFCITSLFHYM